MSADRNSVSRIAQLEILVDELIKDAPVETRVRSCMKAAGLRYTKDPIGRMNQVLSELDGLRPAKPGKGSGKGPTRDQEL